jgi:CheY-like chemotaxis protein
VLADAGKMEQVLMNLSANARDAMGAADAGPVAGRTGGELTISTDRARLDDEFALAHPWAQPGDYVRMTVSDQGSGMDAATRERMFEPFFTTKEAGRGSGLGLAVVYSIVQQHRGLIEVESRPHEGTTIRIYLPFHPAPAEEPAEGDDAGALVGGTETILVAEDDPALRVTATRLLERLGYRVIAVATGREALALLTQRDDIALAVLDMVMPDLGGPQVFARVGRRFPRLRFVFTTGYSRGSSPAGRGGPPAEVLYKPYGLHTLAAAVRRALGSV